MPIVSEQMKKSQKKAERDEKKKKEEAEHKAREEQAKREQEEREAKEKEEQEKKEKMAAKKQKYKDKKEKERKDKEDLERKANMRKEMALIRKGLGAKAIKDEEAMNRDNVSIQRTEVKSGTYSKIYKAKHGDNEALVCKVVLLDKTPQEYRTNLLDMGLKIQRYVGSPADATAPEAPKANAKDKSTDKSAEKSNSKSADTGGEGAAAGAPIAGAGRHPILMRVDDIYATDKKVFIFQSETDPKSIVDKFKKMATVDEAEAKKTLKQLAECIKYLHSVGVAHLNLRTSSVVQDKTTGVKVVGMDGCTFYWDSDNEAVLSRKRLSKKEFDKQPHLPPEAFKADTWNGAAADVWAFGLLMCQVLAKDPPYKLSANKSAEDQWKAFSEGKAFSDEAKQLLDRIFVEDLQTRPSISDVLNDTYFKNVA